MRDRAWNEWSEDRASGGGGWRDGPCGAAPPQQSAWRGGGRAASGDWGGADGHPVRLRAARRGNASGGSGNWGSEQDWSSAIGGGGAAAAGENGTATAVAAAGEEGDDDATGVPAVCGDAKLRLVRLRRRLEAQQAEALEKALKRKRDEWQVTELPLGPEILADVSTVLEQDSWGRDWLKEWLANGVDWARALEELQAARGQAEEEHYCQLCWKACCSDKDMEKHKVSKDHRKRQCKWVWKYGVPPSATGAVGLGCDGELPPAPLGRAPADAIPDAVDPGLGASKAAAELLRRAARFRASPAAAAKRRLLEYRNSLSVEQRQEVLRRIGLPRSNDVGSLRELQAHFQPPIAECLSEVAKERSQDKEDLEWICREPTFSWLSGFYWHPESTSLEQQGEPHSAHFCHLCEADSWTQEASKQHAVTRRHAENALRWAEQMGDMEHPSHCRRCPDAVAASSSSGGRGGRWAEDRDLDLEYRRNPVLPDPEVKPETRPPCGFRENYQGDRGRVLAVPYVAIVVKVDRRACAVRVLSSLPIGPKEKVEKHHGRRQERRSFVDLFWCPHSKSWKSLAIPVRDASPGERVSFGVVVQWSSEGAAAPWEELDELLHAEVPRAGDVAVICADLRQCGVPVWVECKPILSFVGRGQVEAAGGIGELRGTQRPMQFATEDVIISFLFWVPEGDEPRPLLLFFHGDMPRGVAQCSQPGLADFAPSYGPALLVADEKRRGHPCRDFVVLTPCCSEEVWWLRHPAVHDSTAYAENVERCLRGVIDLVYDLGVSRRERGACFAGQSMGAYMALEMARAMPEGTAAVLAGAPCFDACRLSHLAERLVNVPLWLLIGRNDTMCCYEEVASLALKLRDLDAKCVRLTSVGIKGHSEVGKKLEKWEPFEWLRKPLG